jgi:hypothetical protein
MRDDTLMDEQSRPEHPNETVGAFRPDPIADDLLPAVMAADKFLATWNGLAPAAAVIAAAAVPVPETDTAPPTGPDLSFLEPSRAPAPAFPLDAVPERTRELLATLAIGSRVSLDLLATAAWPVLAASIGTSAHLKIAEGVYEASPVWGVLVSGPSSSKSVALRLTARVLASMGMTQVATAAQGIFDDIVAAERKLMQRKAIREALANGQELPPCPADEAEPQSGRSRHTLTDISTAGVMDQLLRQPRGMLVYRDELLGLVRGNLTRGGHQGRALLLEAYDGQPYDYDRHDRSITLPALHLALLGGIQPDKLSALFGREDDGFAARCLIAWPDVERDPTLPSGITLTEGFEPILRRLLELPTCLPFQGHPVQLCARSREISEAAARQWLATARHLQGPLEAVYARAQQVSLRLALVLELAEHAACGLPGAPDAVSPEVMAGAVGLMDRYYLPCAERALYEAHGAEDQDADLRSLARFIARQGKAAFNARELRRSRGCPVRDPARFTALLQRLEVSGCVRRVVSRRAGPGRPAEEYTVDPGLLAVVKLQV